METSQLKDPKKLRIYKIKNTVSWFFLPRWMWKPGLSHSFYWDKHWRKVKYILGNFFAIFESTVSSPKQTYCSWLWVVRTTTTSISTTLKWWPSPLPPQCQSPASPRAQCLRAPAEWRALSSTGLHWSAGEGIPATVMGENSAVFWCRVPQWTRLSA